MEFLWFYFFGVVDVYWNFLFSVVKIVELLCNFLDIFEIKWIYFVRIFDKVMIFWENYVMNDLDEIDF